MPPLAIYSVRSFTTLQALYIVHTLTTSAEFRLYPGNHTVARSDFGTPCLPYEYTGLNRQGFFSGYIGPQVISSDVSLLHVLFTQYDADLMAYSFLSCESGSTIRSRYFSTVPLLVAVFSSI
jgi:hypothetical protein